MSVEIKTWAEVGIWQRGEPALVVMSAAVEDGWVLDTPQVLHDVPLEFPAGFEEDLDDVRTLPWQEALEELGYRRTGKPGEYTPYGFAFDIEEV